MHLAQFSCYIICQSQLFLGDGSSAGPSIVCAACASQRCRRRLPLLRATGATQPATLLLWVQRLPPYISHFKRIVSATEMQLFSPRLLGLQSRFGGKPLRLRVVFSQNYREKTAVLKGSREPPLKLLLRGGILNRTYGIH